MIRAESITKRFGRTIAVDDVSFELGVGESLALWGSNGAGKTTLIRCLLGVFRFRGVARVGVLSVSRRGRGTRAMIGYVPQELAFHDDARMGAAIVFFAGLHRAGRGRAAEALGAVGLVGHERKRVRDLSGGMKQRLAMAIALLADPPIIVLDEPTSNLDAAGRNEIVGALRGLRAAGKTLLFASHRPDEVVGLADRVLVMERGRVVRDTTPGELWPTRGGVQVIRLHLATASEGEAAGVLRQAGHSVHMNGSGLLVTVPRDSKAGPIGVLERSRIEVRDIELIEDVTTERMP